MVGGSKSIKENPKTVYLGILYRIQDRHRTYFEDEDEDLARNIDYYNDKKNLTIKETQELEIICKEAWKSFLNELLDRFKEKTGRRYKMFLRECKLIDKLILRLEKNHLELEDYDNLFQKDIEGLIDDIQTRINNNSTEWKRFFWGIILGFLLGFLGPMIMNYLMSIFP